LKDQDLYLAGEGYAGIYVTYLADKITQHNRDPVILPDQRILLKGLFLGNPCTNNRECHSSDQYNQYSYEYLYNHYYYTERQFSQVKPCIDLDTLECNATRAALDQKFLATGVDRRNIFSSCLKQNTGDYPNIPCLDQLGILKFLNRQ